MNFSPNWVSKPGNTILDILEERGISMSQYASSIDYSADYLEDIIEGVENINFDIAETLAKSLGANANFWLQREKQYRKALAKRVEKDKLESWVSHLPVKEMKKLGWISGEKNNIDECLNFFNVKSFEGFNDKYSFDKNQLAFRKSPAFESKIGSVAAWFRRGEILTSSYRTKDWDKEKFILELEEIKKLTRVKDISKFLPELIDRCKRCGVKLAVVPTPKGCPVSGATKFIDEKTAIIVLSFRYLSDDQFWFTFFHEAGHLVMHGQNRTFLELKKGGITNEEEKEANLFAAEMLVPYNLHSELNQLRSNKRRIVKFAIKAGVSPGIVVGQLQFLGIVRQDYLNGFKRRFNWEDIDDVIKNYHIKLES